MSCSVQKLTATHFIFTCRLLGGIVKLRARLYLVWLSSNANIYVYSVNCAAVNYNSTNCKCTFFYNPCPLTREAPGMKYFVFTKIPAHQCSQWLPYTSHDAVDDRMIASQTGTIMVSRIKYKGNYIIGYEYIPYGQCFTFTTVDEIIVSSGSSAPCERLRIADSCTAFWIPYTAGDTLPARAIIDGRTASGEVAYVLKSA